MWWKWYQYGNDVSFVFVGKLFSIDSIISCFHWCIWCFSFYQNCGNLWCYSNMLWYNYMYMLLNLITAIRYFVLNFSRSFWISTSSHWSLLSFFLFEPFCFHCFLASVVLICLLFVRKICYRVFCFLFLFYTFLLCVSFVSYCLNYTITFILYLNQNYLKC